MTSNDLHAKLFRDRVRAEDWRVEKYDEDGGCEVAIFSGPYAQERARRFADQEYGDFVEIELTPYGD